MDILNPHMTSLGDVTPDTDHAALKLEPDLPSQRLGRTGRFHTGNPQLHNRYEV
jgi:hypothetical protein